MKKLLFVFGFMAAVSVHAQQLTTPVPGGDRKAMVGEQIGLTKVEINYDRPRVKGREGHIWGELVPVGFHDQDFGPSRSTPWRAGANESTTIEFSTDVKIEGKTLPAGKYGFFIAWDPVEPTLIFSKNNTAWGSFYYKESEDALRVKARTKPLAESVEWLKYEFTDQTENSATVTLSWEKMMILFKVEVDLVQTQLASFRKELQSRVSFNWQPWVQAALYSVQHDTNLEEALLWADTATSPIFGGNTQFQAWSAKAQVLMKLKREAEAEAIMKEHLPLANMLEVHQYGRTLMQLGKKKEALEIFKSNYEKYPTQFTTTFGLARGYSANGDYVNALKYAKQALAISPAANKSVVENAIKTLESGKDFN